MRVRPATPNDSPGILDIFAPIVEKTAISFMTEVPSESEQRDKISSSLERFPFYVAESATGAVIGFAYASPHRALSAYRWSAETTIYVSEGAQRTGAATALYSRLFETLQLQGYRNLYAVITLPNLPSQRFHEKMGFRHFAVFEAAGFKLGKWHDVGWWHLRLAHADKMPRDPIPFSNAQLRSRA